MNISAQVSKSPNSSLDNKLRRWQAYMKKTQEKNDTLIASKYKLKLICRYHPEQSDEDAKKGNKRKTLNEQPYI